MIAVSPSTLSPTSTVSALPICSHSRDPKAMRWPSACRLLSSTHSDNTNAAPMQAVAICADLDHHVFNHERTDIRVAEALRNSHWFDLREWTARGPHPGF